MNGPKRLFESSDSPVVRRMLTSAQCEEPSDHAMHATLAALGVGVAAASVSSVVSAATATAASQGTGLSGTVVAAGATLASGAPTAAGTVGVAGSSGVVGSSGALTAASTVGVKAAGAGLLATATKLSAVGIAGGLLTFGVLQQVVPTSAPPRASVVEPVRVVAPRAAPVVAAPTDQTPVTAPVEEEPPVAPRVAPRKTAAPVEPTLSDLEREVALIDSARAAVSRGDGAGASRLLADHARQFPAGRLVPEARYLRMQARAAAGDTAGARDAARELLRMHPSGPHSARARTVLEPGESSSTLGPAED